MYDKYIKLVSLILLTSVLPVNSQSKKPIYLDHTQSIKKRVDDLISRMTLEEKVGQLNIFQIRNFEDPGIRRRFVKGEQLESVGPAGGTFALPVLLGTDTRRQAEFLNELQKIATEDTRLKIPLLVFEEGTHGFRAPRGTIFPEGLAIGSTWNMDLVYKLYVVAAREVAREGIVLLKNDNNLLPLKKNIKSIAVIGPKANNSRNQLGDYVAAKGANGSGGCQTDVVQDVVTVLEGIRNTVSENTRVTYVQGCDELPSELNEIARAKKTAEEAEVTILVVGERGQGETGDVASLDMLGLQNELVESVFGTGTPTIVVLVNGRPLSVRWIAKHAPAVIEAWLIGEQGGNAVADVLFGDYNPGGKLPISIPRHVGQLPIYYNYLPSKTYTMQRYRNRMDYMDMDATPLWEFGFGLSYTKFEYSNLQISPQEIGPAGQVKISVDIQNTGERQGTEVVQLYLDDVISTIVTPDKELRGFKKILLHPGEKKAVLFTLGPEDFFFYNQYCEKIVEPGTFAVMIGSSSEDIRLKGSFEILE